jgi:peptide/nickel transport system substrate-binding protein
MVLGLVAACGGTSDSGNGPPTPPNIGPAVVPSDDEGAPTVSDDTVHVSSKDTVIFTQISEPQSFVIGDKDYSNTPAREGIVIYNIYDSLYWMNWNGTISPRLATEYSVSADGLEYTFKLRDDVYFHNGDKFTAEDVKFTYEIGLEKNTGLAINNLMNFNHADVIDDYTVKLVLKAPYAAFINCTTSRMGLIMSKKYYEEVGAEGYNNAPIGTGAYKFKERVIGEKVTLVANDDYWNGAPLIKNLVVKPLENLTTQFLALENGEVDVIGTANISQCIQLNNPKLTWGYVPSSDRNLLAFHSVTGIGKDKNIRKAIQYALNKEDILLGAIEGYGTVLDYDVLQTYKGAPDPSKLVTVKQDVEKAKEYLKAANYNGEKFIIEAVAGSTQETVAAMIQGQLMAIGMNVEIKTADSQTSNTLINDGSQIDAWVAAHASTLMDISTFQWHYLLNETNGPRYDPELLAKTGEIVKKTEVEMDDAKRQEQAAELLNISTEEALIIPLYNGVMAAAWNDGIKGIQPHLNGIVYESRLWYWE